MLSDESKIVRVGKQGGARLYIPSNVVNDSQFPFEMGEKVEVKIDTEQNIVIISGANSIIPTHDR